jgi:hypothetical protein
VLYQTFFIIFLTSPGEIIVMRVNRHWDVKIRRRLLHKKHRIVIEIHGSPSSAASLLSKQEKTPAPSRRGLLRSAPATPASGDRTIVNLSNELQDDDRILIRILKKKSKRLGFLGGGDDASGSDEDDEGEDSVLVDETTTAAASDDGWVEFHKYDLDEISDEHLHENQWEATMGRASNTERRTLTFETDEQGMCFV